MGKVVLVPCEFPCEFPAIVVTRRVGTVVALLWQYRCVFLCVVLRSCAQGVCGSKYERSTMGKLQEKGRRTAVRENLQYDCGRCKGVSLRTHWSEARPKRTTNEVLPCISPVASSTVFFTRSYFGSRHLGGDSMHACRYRCKL